MFKPVNRMGIDRGAIRPRVTGMIIAAAVVAGLAGGPAPAQVEVGLALEPKQALVYEPVNAQITIRNNTGGVLDFGSGNNAARFYFEVRRDHSAVDQLDHSPLLFGTRMVPAGSLTNGFNLTAMFSLQSRGDYKITACLEWNNTLFASPAAVLEMQKGVEIARVIAGVPGDPGALRLYVLEYLSKHNGEYVYLLIEDEQSGKVYGMFNLGRIVRVRKPEIKIDEAGNVHVLFQSSAMVFIHTAFTPYGVQLFSRSYADKSNRIYLVSLPNGQIGVPPGYSAVKVITGEDQIREGAPASSNAPVAVKSRLSRGGLFGPKTE